MAVIIALPFVVLMPVIVHFADIGSVKVIPVIISSPINISLGIAIVVATIRVSRRVKAGA
jgi:hypothetical protein